MAEEVRRTEILRRYANGGELRSISTDLGIDHEAVVSVVAELGFQRPRAAEELKRLLRPGADKPVAEVRPQPPVVEIAPKPTSRGLVGVLARADDAGGRFAARAAKIRAMVDALSEELAAAEDLIAAEKAVEEARALLASRTDALKKLKPPSATKSGSSDIKPIRAWAAANDIPCPKFGRIPVDVIKAYEEAHRG